MGEDLLYRPSWYLVWGKGFLRFSEAKLNSRSYGFLYDTSFSVYRGLVRARYFLKVVAAALLRRSEFEKLLNVWRVMPHSLVGASGLEVSFQVIVDLTKRGIQGDVVECGVAKGGCAALMGVAIKRYSPQRTLWLFDSYEGLPKPGEKDFEEGATGNHLRPLPEGACCGTFEYVKTLLTKFQLPLENIKMVKGWFENTLPVTRDQIGPIAVLRLDGDWYESTKVCLKELFPKVVPGGCVIIDDYGTCYGARRAVDEFLKENNLSGMALENDGRGGIHFFLP